MSNEICKYANHKPQIYIFISHIYTQLNLQLNSYTTMK